MPHRGHLNNFQVLNSSIYIDDVYITTSNITNHKDSFFDFEERVFMLAAMGIPREKIIKCRLPFRPAELIEQLDHKKYNYVFVFAVGMKDQQSITFKENGYFFELDNLATDLHDQGRLYDKTGYLHFLDHNSFCLPPEVTETKVESATELRQMYKDLDLYTRISLVKKMYPYRDSYIVYRILEKIT